MTKQKTITEHISTSWYSYAKYVITKRGIPNFYDGLTNVQRVILNNAPTNFAKSVSIVGSAIKSGYHHGNASLEGSLNGMTKEYGCAETLLLGDGFFGSPVSESAAAARYTSIKVNPIIKEEVDKFKALNEVNEEGLPIKFHAEIPIGMVGGNTGIGIGFKSYILPRKLDEIQKYCNGEEADLTPYFKNFDGHVESYTEDPSKWVVIGNHTLSTKGSYKLIIITEIPPIDKYETFIRKINNFLDKKNISSIKISNNSQSKINLELKTKSNKDFAELKKYINRSLRSVTTENVGFIRDGRLVEYNSFKDYLDDFKIYRQELYLDKFNFDLNSINFDLKFNQAKLKFLKYMQGNKASKEEIKKFLSRFNNEKISSRLLAFPLYKMSNEEIHETTQTIIDIKSDIKYFKNQIKDQKQKVKTLLDNASSKVINYDFGKK